MTGATEKRRERFYRADRDGEDLEECVCSVHGTNKTSAMLANNHKRTVRRKGKKKTNLSSANDERRDI